MGLGRVDRRERQPRQHLVEKSLELLAGHPGRELESLDARLGEAL
jgi:hypothetical protein